MHDYAHDTTGLVEHAVTCRVRFSRICSTHSVRIMTFSSVASYVFWHYFLDVVYWKIGIIRLRIYWPEIILNQHVEGIGSVIFKYPDCHECL